MKKVTALLVGVFMFCVVGSASATSISFTTEDKGGGTWEYEYTVSDRVFDSSEGFTIWFDYGLYADLTVETNSSDWDAITWEPADIGGFPDPGAYDAIAMTANPSLDETFVMSFTWLGGTVGPGVQDFDVYDINFTPVEWGQTVMASNQPVPEPCTMLLMGTGLAGLIGLKRKKSLKV